MAKVLIAAKHPHSLFLCKHDSQGLQYLDATTLCFRIHRVYFYQPQNGSHSLTIAGFDSSEGLSLPSFFLALKLFHDDLL